LPDFRSFIFHAILCYYFLSFSSPLTPTFIAYRFSFSFSPLYFDSWPRLPAMRHARRCLQPGVTVAAGSVILRFALPGASKRRSAVRRYAALRTRSAMVSGVAGSKAALRTQHAMRAPARRAARRVVATTGGGKRRAR